MIEHHKILNVALATDLPSSKLDCGRHALDVPVRIFGGQREEIREWLREVWLFCDHGGTCERCLYEGGTSKGRRKAPSAVKRPYKGDWLLCLANASPWKAKTRIEEAEWRNDVA